MSTLVDNARNHINSMLAELDGDEDFMPFMTIRGRDTDGIIYAALMMPEEADEKDHVADMMVAMCAMHRAVDVVFASTVWMVAQKDDVEAQSTPPSRHPDRVERVFIHHLTADGDAAYSTPVIRQNNTVNIGEWETLPTTRQIGGRFADAIHLGMRMGAELPPEMCAYVDNEVEAGRGEGVIESFLNAMGMARKMAAAEKN